MKSSPEIKHIDQFGDFVEADDARSAYVVNMADEDAQEFIASIKVKAGLAWSLKTSPLRFAAGKDAEVDADSVKASARRAVRAAKAEK